MNPQPSQLGPREHVASPAGGAHVHVRVGPCHIAIPVEQVREALPMPAEGLTPLPRRTGALLGLLHTRGIPVPVVGLERWLPLEPASDNDAQRLLVLQHADGQIALRVDAVLGVKAAPPGGARKVHRTPDCEELFDAVVPATEQAPSLCLLEVARLMQLSAVWCAAADLDAAARGPRSDAAAPPSPEAGSAQRHAVFRIGDELWAVPVGVVERVMPVPSVELALGSGRRSWAISEWQGRKLPLVDISTGHAASSCEAAPWMVLVRQGHFALGLTVAACLRFVDLSADACAATPEDELLAGVALLPDLGEVRVLDPDKLFGLTPEISISRDVGPSADAEGAPGDVGEPMPYLVFEAEQRYASAVEGIVGVVELPEATRVALRTGAPAVLAWRGRTLRIFNLPNLTGATAGMDPRLAVLVQPGGDTGPVLGIAIKALSDWLPAHSARRSGVRMGSIGALSLIDAPGNADLASLVVVDLAQLAYLLD